MTPSRPLATVLAAMLATVLVAGCAQNTRQTPASTPTPSGSPAETRSGPAPAAPRPEPNTAAPFTAPFGAPQPTGSPGAQASPSATPAPATSPQPAASGQLSPEQAEKARQAYRSALARFKASIDTSWLDVRARQAKVGTDPKAIAAFVQHDIRYEAYAGALRGARGALLSKAGNSTDRALLLAGLLRAAGHTVRFAEGTLSPSQAEQLVRAGFKSPAAPDATSPLSEILQRAGGHFLLLGNALYDAGFKAPTGDAGRWSQTVREAQRHVWVQVRLGGQWHDVDASPGVAYGRTLVAATRTADELDRTLFHTVTFRLEVEATRDGRREIKRILEYTGLASDLTGTAIGLFHDRQPLAATPVLVVGGQAIKGTLVSSPAQGLGGDITRGLGPLIQAPLGDSLTAEWLKIRVAGPSGEREAVYTIVDTVGPVARDAGQPPADRAKADREMSDALDAALGLVVATGRMPTVLLDAWLADVSDQLTERDVIRVLAAQSAAYFLTRSSLPSSFFNAFPMSYVDAPAVVVSRVDPPHQPDLAAPVSMDLTLKAYRTLRTPEDPLKDTGSFYDGLASGVLDHTVERWVVGAEQAEDSVGTLVEKAFEHDIPLRVFKSPDLNAVRHLTADGRIRLSHALSERLAILPIARPPAWQAPLGWWSIEPSTGWTEDTTEQGGHSAAERGYVQRAILRFCRGFAAVGRRVAAVGMLVAVMGGEDSPTPNNPWSAPDVEEVVEGICGIAGIGSGGGKTPRVPPPGPYRKPPGKPGFPSTSPKFPNVPKPKAPPDVPKFFPGNGGWMKWR